MKSKSFLLVKGCGGLGNRLLSLTASLSYAQKTGRKVVVDWRDGRYAPLGIDAFTRVFTLAGAVDLQSLYSLSNPSIYPSSWLQEALDEPINSLFELRKSPYVDIPSHFLPRGRLRMLNRFWGRPAKQSNPRQLGLLGYLSEMLRLRNFPLGRDLSYKLSPSVVIFADFASHCSPTHLKPRLELSAEMQKVVNATHSRYLSYQKAGRRIGVHIRSTDRSPKRSVMGLVELLLSCTYPNDNIYLATDNPYVEMLIRQAFPKQVFPKNNYYPTNYLQGIHRTEEPPEKKDSILKEAVTDLWMLSHVDCLFFQGSSTFSVVAAAFLPPSSVAYDWERCVAKH